MLRRKKQSCGNNKAAWPQTPYKALERRHGRRHSKGQTPLHFLNLKWNFPCMCVFLNDLCFCNDPSLKNLSARGGENLCHCSLLYSRKSVEVTTAKQGMVGMARRGTVGISRCDNTSITHCQILVSIPMPPMCWGEHTGLLAQSDFAGVMSLPWFTSQHCVTKSFSAQQGGGRA